MKIAIIDADFLGRMKHRFSNLACEKISAYWKGRGVYVELKLNYKNLDRYGEVLSSKVFTDIWIPEWISEKVDINSCEVNLSSNIHVSSTGFFFANAPNLDYGDRISYARLSSL